jgi:hypothetical protein
MARRAAGQWGVLSTAELLECGLTYAAISRRGHNGFLHQLYAGVWAVGHPNPPLEGRLLAAVKACGPGAVLSHRAAAGLWGFLDSDWLRPEVLVVGSGTRIHAGLTTHRTARLDPQDVTRRRGVPVTAPARTLLDLAAVLDEGALRAAVRRAQGMRKVKVSDLVEVVRRLGPKRGSRLLTRIIASGPAPTYSVLEDLVLDLLLGAGIAHPEVNSPLTIRGRRVVPDFRWPEQRLVLEADGAAWHDDKIARENDAERQALLEAHGERVVRVTWAQALNRRAETLARLRAAGAPFAIERRESSGKRK